jgi:hypothetical protein
MQTEKKVYAQPELTVHGNIEVITKSTNTGLNLDGSYVKGTPIAGHLS